MDLKKASQISLIFIGIVVGLFLMQYFEGFLRPLGIALILSFLFTPFFQLSGAHKARRYLKFAIAFLVVIALIVILSNFIGHGIKAITDISKTANLTISSSEGTTFSFLGFEINPLEFVDMDKIGSFVGHVFQSIGTGFIDFAGELFLVILLLLFIVPAQKAYLHKLKIRRTIDKKDKGAIRAIKIFEDLEKGISEYLKTKTLISLMVTLASALVMIVLGIDNVLIFSVLLFSLNFIPNFGDYISFSIIFGVQLFTIGLGGKFFLLLFLLLAVQLVFANYVEPRFAGKKLELSPLTVFLSLLFWGAIWGIGGMLFSIPFTLAIKTFLKHNSDTKRVAEMIS